MTRFQFRHSWRKTSIFSSLKFHDLEQEMALLIKGFFWRSLD